MENEINSIEKTIAEHLVQKIDFSETYYLRIFEMKYTIGDEINFNFLNEIDPNTIISLIGTDASSLEMNYEKVGESIAKWCLSDVYRNVRKSQRKLDKELEHTSYGGGPHGDPIIDECYWGIYYESLKHLNFTEIAKHSIEMILKSRNNK